MYTPVTRQQPLSSNNKTPIANKLFASVMLTTTEEQRNNVFCWSMPRGYN
jgi:hypothetical protein